MSYWDIANVTVSGGRRKEPAPHRPVSILAQTPPPSRRPLAAEHCSERHTGGGPAGFSCSFEWQRSGWRGEESASPGSLIASVASPQRSAGTASSRGLSTSQQRRVGEHQRLRQLLGLGEREQLQRQRGERAPRSPGARGTGAPSTSGLEARFPASRCRPFLVTCSPGIWWWSLGGEVFSLLLKRMAPSVWLPEPFWKETHWEHVHPLFFSLLLRTEDSVFSRQLFSY